MDFKYYINQITDYLYTQMDNKTSCILFGSIMTNDWVETRSDIDLAVIIPTIDLYPNFRVQLDKLKSKLPREVIDGFIFVEDDTISTGLLATNDFEFQTYDARVLPTDKWKLKNESKLIFGNSKIKSRFSGATPKTLKQWAKDNKQEYWIPMIQDTLHKLNSDKESKMLQLTPAIWMVSGVGRIATLSQTGKLCSKQDSLKWMANNNKSQELLIKNLINQYKLSDQNADQLTRDEMILLCNISLNTLAKVD